MTLGMGVSFAFPASAAFDPTNTLTHVRFSAGSFTGGKSVSVYQATVPNCSSVATDVGNETQGGFYFAPQTQDVIVDSINIVAGFSRVTGQFVTGTSPLEINMGIEEQNGGLDVVNGNGTDYGDAMIMYHALVSPSSTSSFWTDHSTTLWATSTFEAPTFPGKDLRVIFKVGKLYRFTFAPTFPDTWPPQNDGMFYAVAQNIFPSNTSTAALAFPAMFEYGYTDRLLTNPCSSPNDYYQENAGFSGAYNFPLWQLNGTFQDNGSNPVDVPTSTYDGTYSDLLPGIGFGTGTAVLPSGIYSAKFSNMFGSATGTFPLCMVAPWIAFLDVFQGFTQVQQSATTIVLTSPLGGDTIVLSLASASSTFAAIGLKNVLDLLLPFLEGLAWLTFGVVVFRRIFMNESESNETL